jgi:excisionase family DNA binding protein
LYIPRDIYEELVDVVRPREAAAMIGETAHMVHYWARRGHIGFVQFDGTQRMLSREELQAFLEYRRAAQKKLKRGDRAAS